MIDATKRFAPTQGIERSAFEFQMLYGIRRDLQRALVSRGLSVPPLRAVRHGLVPVLHAAARRTAGQRRVRPEEHPPRRALSRLCRAFLEKWWPLPARRPASDARRPSALPVRVRPSRCSGAAPTGSRRWRRRFARQEATALAVTGDVTILGDVRVVRHAYRHGVWPPGRHDLQRGHRVPRCARRDAATR